MSCEGILSPSKPAPDWVTHRVEFGCISAPGTLSPYFYIKDFEDIRPHASSLVLNERVSNTSKSAFDWVTYGLKLGCKVQPVHYFLIYTQYFNKVRPQRLISGAERRCNKPIKIRGPIGRYCLWGEIGVQTCTEYFIYPSEILSQPSFCVPSEDV